MKKTLLASVAGMAGALLVSSAANAALTITVDPTVTNYATDLLAVPDTQIIWDFDSIFNPLFTYAPLTATGIGNTPNVSRAPLGDDTIYGVVDPSNSPATFTALKGLKSFSYLVGSPDTFNRIVFTRTDNMVLADLTGATGLFGTVSPVNGSNTAYRINYDFGADKVGKIQFYSNVNAKSFAFEFDRFAGVVPEPATWAMMITGFFGLGTVLRSSRRRQAVAA